MSLQVWLPLIGNVNNLGLSNVTSSLASGITYSDGKIGKCLSASSNVTVTITLSNLATMLANGTTYSLSCWVKLTNNVTSGWVIKLGTNTCGLWWANSAARWVWNENDNGKRCANETISADTSWHHLVTTVDKTVTNKITTRHYVDGLPASGYETYTWDCSSQSQPTGTTITLYPYIAMLNDIRLYDHALSPKEVKEISKGLVCHYALDNNGYGMANLLGNTNTNRSDRFGYSEQTGGSTASVEWDGGTPCTKITRNSTVHSGWAYMWHNNLYTSDLKVSTTYTVSFDCIASGSGTIGLSGFMNGNATNQLSASTQTIQGSFNSTSWSHMVFRTTTKSSFADLTVSGQVVYMSCSYMNNVNVWIKVKNFKVEEGALDTPWCPHISDASYAIFNINGNKEIDISGYGNHGTKSGAITYNSDTPRYSISTVFNGSNTFIACGRGGMVKDAITISSWVYADNWANINTIWSCTEGGGWSSGKDGSVYRFYMGTGTSSNTYKTVDAMALSSITTGWHLITGTYDGFNVKIYIDGVLKGTNAAYTTKTPIFYASSNGIFIGAEAGGNQTTPAGSYTACKISDFRIYATALSDANILELYKTSASIDNKGNILGYDFNE